MRPSKIQNNISFVPIHITSKYEEIDLATGTAFFYTYEGQDYFITNWHNVTGRRPWDHSCISKDAAIPDNLVIRVPYEESLEGGGRGFKWVPRVLKLYEDDDRIEPVWWEHPEYGSDVDVVAVKIGGLSETNAVVANAESLELELLQLVPGMDVFVLGFPRNISGGGRLPIWKRGSIASEPDINIDNLPKLYIDTATREGMSGAPVYAQESGFWAPEGKTLLEDGVFGKAHRFIGIYSGRVGNDPFAAQLGVVWKEEAIQEIIRSKKIGIASSELTKK